MTAPRRVQVTGDLFHGRIPPGAVYVGRQARGLPRSPFANPFTVKEFGREEAVALYREYLLTTLACSMRPEPSWPAATSPAGASRRSCATRTP